MTLLGPQEMEQIESRDELEMEEELAPGVLGMTAQGVSGMS